MVREILKSPKPLKGINGWTKSDLYPATKRLLTLINCIKKLVYEFIFLTKMMCTEMMKYAEYELRLTSVM